MLLEHDGGEHGGLETMRAAMADDAAEAAERGSAARLLVVGQPIQVPLDVERSAQAVDQVPLAPRERPGERPGV